MVEKIVYDYLTANPAIECNVYMEKPTTQPDKYILVEKIGGSIENHIRSAMIVVQSYAKSLYEAAVLNETVIAEMRNIVTLGSVSMCELNSEHNYTDVTKKQYRYQAVFNLAYF